MAVASDTIKIETYWNVNILLQQIKTNMLTIKIETYWNVNTINSGAGWIQKED